MGAQLWYHEAPWQPDAAEALKVVGGMGETLSGRLLWLDARTMQWRSVGVQRDPLCPVCAGRPHRHEPTDTTQ